MPIFLFSSLSSKKHLIDFDIDDYSIPRYNNIRDKILISCLKMNNKKLYKGDEIHVHR